jgi:hypothetical protein
VTRPTSSAGEVEQLGKVDCPSGILLILDGKLACIWSHDRPPSLPSELDVSGKTEDARDFVVLGADALAAGRAFDRSNNPLFIYDQLDPDALRLAFNKFVSERNLDASLEELADRVPHRRRVDLALEVCGGAGAVEFHGMWAVAVGGVPRDRSMLIMGERMPSGSDEGRWRRIWIDLRDGEIMSHRAIGHVLVDEARLMAVDVDRLGAWDDISSQDGKADVVFWGRDGAAVASEVGAELIQSAETTNMFGWLDLPVVDAQQLAMRIQALRSDQRRFALDFRPHTHQWQVMRDVRAARTESGVIDLAGGSLCMFMTTWGDGGFPIEADLGDDGQIIRLRIETGCPEIIARQRDLEERWSGE